MKSRDWNPALILGWILAAAAVPGLARAEDEYELGTDDVIGITIWDHPELSRTVVVRSNGTISLPPIGDVPASGKTPAALGAEIEARLNSSLRLNAQVTVSVTNYNSRRVYLSGAVNAPGRYSFEIIPGLIDVLGSGGGLSPTADLSQVRIIRRSEGKTKTLTVDVANALRSGDFSGVPALESGDVIFVPATGTGAAVAAASSAVYFGGEVAKPGALATPPGLSLLQGLTLAGGTTPRADLGRVMVIAGSSSQSYLIQVDVTQGMAQGRAGIVLRPGDTVWVPSRDENKALQAWELFRESLGISRDLIDLVLLRNALR